MKKHTLKFINKQITITPEEYDSLMRLDINREIKIQHVNSMQESVERHGILRNVIIVFIKHLNKYAIVDGQHLSVALQNMGMDIPCTLVNCQNDEEVTQLMIDLNNTSKSWSVTNFLNAYCKNGIYEYQKALKVTKEHKLTISDFEFIYLGNGEHQHKSFKQGLMKFANEKDSDKLLDAVLKVRSHISNKAVIRRALIKVMRLTNDYAKFANIIVNASKALAENEASFSSDEKEFHAHLLKLHMKHFNAK